MAVGDDVSVGVGVTGVGVGVGVGLGVGDGVTGEGEGVGVTGVVVGDGVELGVGVDVAAGMDALPCLEPSCAWPPPHPARAAISRAAAISHQPSLLP